MSIGWGQRGSTSTRGVPRRVTVPGGSGPRVGVGRAVARRRSASVAVGLTIGTIAVGDSSRL